MTIPTLPPLERTSPSFAADLDTFFLTQLPATIPAFNAEIERVNQFAFGSYSATSTTSLTVGTGSKSLTIETGKGFTLGQPVLIASTAAPSTYLSGQVTAYDSATGAMTVNVTSISGGGAAAVWSVSVSSVLFGVPSPLLQRTITATGTLSSSDKGKLINVNGTFTLGAAAATLGAGWFCYLRNTGTGVITLDPNASETVDGVTSGPVRGTILLICDGADFTAIRQGPFTTTEMLNSGTSWTAPLGVRTIRARGQGGSGGAGGPAGARTGGGGGGGFDVVAAVSPGTTYTYVIGGCGADGAPGGDGTNGGATTLDIGGVQYYASPGFSTNNLYAGGGASTAGGAFPMQGETGQSSHSGVAIYGRGALSYGPGGNMVLNGGVLVLEY